MKEVILFSDFKISDNDRNLILESAKKNTLKLDPEMKFSYKGLIETDKAKYWVGDQSKEFVKSLRSKYPPQKFHLVGAIVNKALLGYYDDTGLIYGRYFDDEKAFLVSNIRRTRFATIEEVHRILTHEIGESKGLIHHDNPECFMHDVYIKSEIAPSEFCSYCLSKV